MSPHGNGSNGPGIHILPHLLILVFFTLKFQSPKPNTAVVDKKPATNQPIPFTSLLSYLTLTYCSSNDNNICIASNTPNLSPPSCLCSPTITYSSSDPWSCDPCNAYAAVAPATNASVAADSTTAANNGAKKNICLTSFFYFYLCF